MVLFALALLAPAPAHAKLYGGLSIGEASTSDLHASDFDDGSFISSRTDDSDRGWKGFVGYRFLKFFSLELAYADLGEMSISAESDGSGFEWAAGDVNLSAAVDTIALEAMGVLPLGERFSVFAKYGYHRWDAALRATDSSGVESTSDDDNDAVYGLGVNFNFKGPGSVRLEYEVYEVDTIEVDLLSIGLAFRF
jgi:OOP family OmpA-OmpF porin